MVRAGNSPSFTDRLLRAGLAVALVMGIALAGTVPLRAAPSEAATAERAEMNGLEAAVTKTSDGREAAANRVVVGFQPKVSDADKAAVHRAVTASAGASGGTKRLTDTTEIVDVTGAPSLDAAIKAYLNDPHVRYAEPDYIVHAQDIPNDPYFSDQYGMAKVHAPAAWTVTQGVATVKIAILDCGIYEDHPDLAGKVAARQDFTGGDTGTDDRCNHGTHVAGIAAADTNNTLGVAGLGYNTELLNGKVLSDGGWGYDSQIADGIRWAADNGANVINMSLGGLGACSQTFQDAIDYAWSKNVVIIAAAGNSGMNTLFQPATCNHVVAVASTDGNDAKSSFSNFGTWVQVAAPGSAIFSTVNPNLAENNGNAYTYLSGTSMATPLVAGLAGLVWATSWGTSAQAVVQRIESTADPIAGTGTQWHYGRINALAAVAPDTTYPTATNLSPNTVPIASPAFTLTITGTHFRPGATVLWNGAARPATSVTDTQVTTQITVSDLRQSGRIQVAVANTDGTTTTPAIIFTITAPPPHPTALSPPIGSTAGGTLVTITGSGFQMGASVIFDGVAASVVSVTDTQIVVATPGHAAGVVDVIVKNSDGQSQMLAQAYTYAAPKAGAPDTRTSGAAPAPAPDAIPVGRATGPPPASSSGGPQPPPAPIPVSRQ